MSILSPTNMGNVIDLSGYLQARQNRLTTNATDIANTLKAFENARDVINRRNLFNPIKGQMDTYNSYLQKQKELETIKKNMGDYEAKNSVEVPDFVNQYKDFTYQKGVTTPEQVTALQQTLKDAGYDLGNTGPNKDGVDGGWGTKTESALADYLEKHPDTFKKEFKMPNDTERKYRLQDENGNDVSYDSFAYKDDKQKAEDLQKWLDENKGTYDNFSKNYGWILDPSFNFANEEYIRTGNSSLLSNLKNQWATQQLQKAQIEKDKATKELEENKSLKKVYDNTKIAIEGIKGEKGKKLTAEGVYAQEQKIREGIAELERANRKAEAEELKNLFGKKVKEGTTNDENEKKADAEKKAKEDAKWALKWEEHVKKGDVGIMGYFGNDKATYIKNRGIYNGEQY